MEEKPNYYAVIPADVRYDNDLKDKAKLLYGEILALSNKEGYCWATNNYFAELYGISKMTVSRLIQDLANKKYINIEIKYKKNSKEIEGRYIKICIYPIYQNVYTPIYQKLKDNNTSINNININNKENNTKEKKSKYGEFKNVLLTDKEYQKLNEDYNNLEDIIKFLDEYIEEKGYKSKSHNLAIRRWVADAVSEKKVKRKEAKQFDRPAWLDMDL